MTISLYKFLFVYDFAWNAVSIVVEGMFSSDIYTNYSAILLFSACIVDLIASITITPSNDLTDWAPRQLLKMFGVFETRAYVVGLKQKYHIF